MKCPCFSGPPLTDTCKEFVPLPVFLTLWVGFSLPTGGMLVCPELPLGSGVPRVSCLMYPISSLFLPLILYMFGLVHLTKDPMFAMKPPSSLVTLFSAPTGPLTKAGLCFHLSHGLGFWPPPRGKVDARGCVWVSPTSSTMAALQMTSFNSLPSP